VTLPDPLAVEGAVAVDQAARTVTVVPAAPGFPAMLWRHGYERLARAERSGRGYGAVPTVWAHGFGEDRIGPGLPEGGALRFTFRRGDPAWAQLVGTAGLTCIITLDRRSERILAVGFRGRR
jgi:hypothetical protein